MIKKSYVRRLKALCDFASDRSKGFVFGWEFYTPSEAFDAMVNSVMDDMRHNRCSFEEQLEEYKKCMCDE